MSDQTVNDEIKRGRRPEKTYSKHVMLTEYGRARIEGWARENQLNFSAAIETLALLGLDDERSTFIIPALRATTLQGIRLTFNRQARLLSDIALEAAVARTMSEGIMLQLVRQAAAEHPEDFEEELLVRRDSRAVTDTRIRRFHDGLKARVEETAVQRLRRTLSQIEELFQDGKEEEA
jgi:hypothetical protein